MIAAISHDVLPSAPQARTSFSLGVNFMGSSSAVSGVVEWVIRREGVLRAVD